MLRAAHIVILLILTVILTAIAVPVCAQTPADPLPPAARITGLRHEFQTWNNCGPVNLTMVLSYYGWPHDQQTAAAWLKPTVADKNVSPWELVAYVNVQRDLPPMRALWRYGGDLRTLKALVAAGFPVIVESGFQPEGHEWMGHYITLVAYEDATETIWTFDSYNGSNQTESYAHFDEWWWHFNRAFVVVYPAEREANVMAILGPLADSAAASQSALETAQRETATQPSEPWAYYNAGTSAAALQNYAQAARYYDRVFKFDLPDRMLWYQFGPYDAYYHTGRYADVLAITAEVQATAPENEDIMVWRGLALAAVGDIPNALAELDRAVQFNPHNPFALESRALVASGSYTPPAPFRLVTVPIP